MSEPGQAEKGGGEGDGSRSIPPMWAVRTQEGGGGYVHWGASGRQQQEHNVGMQESGWGGHLCREGGKRVDQKVKILRVMGAGFLTAREGIYRYIKRENQNAPVVLFGIGDTNTNA